LTDENNRNTFKYDDLHSNVLKKGQSGLLTERAVIRRASAVACVNAYQSNSPTSLTASFWKIKNNFRTNLWNHNQCRL